MPEEIPAKPYGAPQSVEEVEELKPATDPGLSGYEPPPYDDPALSSASGGGGGRIVKILLALVLAIGIIGGMIFFISRYLNGGKQEGPIVLTYWGLWESEAVMQTVFTDYTRDHPDVTIQYSMNSPVQYRERLQAAIERGEGPDIFRFHNTWLPMLKKNLVPFPKDVVSQEELNTQFYKSVSNDLVVDGSLYGLPLMTDGLMLFYNKDLLSTIGASFPTTWEEFEDVSFRLTRKSALGEIEQAGAAIGTADNIEHFSDILGLIMYQNGVDFTNLLSAEAEQALTYYTLFAQKPNNVWDNQQENSIFSFSSGKVGMIFAPSWQIFTITALNPSLNFTTASVPQLKGATPIAWGNYWAEGVSTKSQNQREAFEFIRYLTSPEVESKLYTESVKEGRSFGQPYSRTELTDQLKSNVLIAPLANMSPIMRSWYMASRTHDLGINDKNIKYFQDAVNAVYQGSSPKGALETASAGVNQVLKEYGVIK